jgi:aryl-alcohol dehydrogenase-like predicted oxidoreductase
MAREDRQREKPQDREHLSMEGIAMPFPLHDPGAATVPNGAAKPAGLRDNLDPFDTRLPQEPWRAFNDVAMNQ